jgi:hypothetical protein
VEAISGTRSRSDPSSSSAWQIPLNGALDAKVDPVSYPPGLLAEPSAARWLGISVSTLRTLGIRRRVIGRRKLYDLRDLAAFRDNLPYEDQGRETDEEACDRLFGLAR